LKKVRKSDHKIVIQCFRRTYKGYDVPQCYTKQHWNKVFDNNKFIIDFKVPLDGAISIDDYWILISFEDSMLKIKYFYIGRFFIFLHRL
jgi:hypothetical protein